MQEKASHWARRRESTDRARQKMEKREESFTVVRTIQKNQKGKAGGNKTDILRKRRGTQVQNRKGKTDTTRCPLGG